MEGEGDSGSWSCIVLLFQWFLVLGMSLCFSSAALVDWGRKGFFPLLSVYLLTLGCSPASCLVPHSRNYLYRAPC
ncbi:uncharacterized protein B0H64DRAFT_389163 [Chaetomium fimeti]|uniref:Uncharacterized protein n=1 Tax=Chaetomium fimeti TaxID=1854472 RepID=A0AAE0HN75_9PEZI|nr:hypothetical protein B0H64DRAFT_389163 [Chaetomium fimeti]